MHSSSLKPCLCWPQCFAVLVACPAPSHPPIKDSPKAPRHHTASRSPTSHSEQKPDIVGWGGVGWGGVGWGWMGWGGVGSNCNDAPWYCPLPFLLERANSNKVRALQPTAAATEHKTDLRWCGARERKSNGQHTVSMHKKKAGGNFIAPLHHRPPHHQAHQQVQTRPHRQLQSRSW